MLLVIIKEKKGKSKESGNFKSLVIERKKEFGRERERER